MNKFGIDVQACRARQQRLVQVMQTLELDLVIVNQTEHVQWLTGPRYPWVLSTAAAIDASGRVTLICPHPTPTAAADEIVVYDAKWHSTLRNDQPAEVAAALLDALPQTAKTVGIEFSSCGPHITQLMSTSHRTWVDIEPDLYRLRRRKDPDELAKLQKAIRATELMYEKARAIIEPGVSELDVFNELQSVAVREFGEMLTGTGNDYQCNSRGGPPRPRTANAEELYILDLGPAFQGYFADNARTIAVTEADKNQRIAWQSIVEVFGHIQATVRPGVCCRQLFEEAQVMLDRCPVGKFNHHLGHGIGLFPHEAPHLNPHWQDTFEEGDVFTVEPGLYDPELLRAGIRLENDYVVTASGVQLLTDFALDL